ncbi:MAG: cysteine--tRNA ligase [Atopostipes suicloacalis]|nr:cysteine--tRNA ligase [Atopostipes suicloacalis]MDN6730606.1 cysteine--tRNA ligase [Atopostipes suicloacalis]
MIKIYNSLSRKKEIFRPIEAGKVKIYLCGPTVYNYIHIGNARSAVSFDTVRRYFEYKGFEVTYVSNFTDVDDKIIQAAKELEIEAPELADKFIQAFFEDTQALGVKKADHHPRVMENISEIIAFIEGLIEKSYAYEVKGDVYYRTRKFSDYGKLSGITIDELKAGASERLDESVNKKEDSVDFTLWKKAKEDEISWDSPWGKGRPGWHIECSAMACKYLGETIDIHAGGQDLSFPHHENEIAQTEALTDKKFANYWMHNGFVTMADEKMSKSLGNVKLMKDLRKEYDPQVLRFFLATAHYRRPLSYTKPAIQDAENNLKQIKTAISNAHHRLNSKKLSVELASDHEFLKKWDKKIWDFEKAMDNDFQAQNAMTVVYEMVRLLNRSLDEEKASERIIKTMLESLTEILAIFGLEELYDGEDLLDEAIDSLIEEREEARRNQRYDRADEIRDQLKEKGILLEDTPQGIRWKRE